MISDSGPLSKGRLRPHLMSVKLFLDANRTADAINHRINGQSDPNRGVVGLLHWPDCKTTSERSQTWWKEPLEALKWRTTGSADQFRCIVRDEGLCAGSMGAASATHHRETRRGALLPRPDQDRVAARQSWQEQNHATLAMVFPHGMDTAVLRVYPGRPASGRNAPAALECRHPVDNVHRGAKRDHDDSHCCER